MSLEALDDVVPTAPDLDRPPAMVCKKVGDGGISEHIEHMKIIQITMPRIHGRFHFTKLPFALRRGAVNRGGPMTADAGAKCKRESPLGIGSSGP
jgi:hypothetical protein